ncbi:MAG: alanine racemase [Candidatus Azotimanducaceae bacterium WSBS_2022_MAG_OTU7]
MKRRRVLLGAMGGLAAVGTGALLWRPKDIGAPHNAYFSALNDLLKREGSGIPVMLLDLDRVNSNIDVIAESVGADKTYRVVVKSLPSVPLLRHVMGRAKTNSLMVFHQPFLNEIARAFPDADALLGKPMPVSAAATFYKKVAETKYDAEAKVQWLIDSPQRLDQYYSLARDLGVKMRVNLEIDVGLRRGGIPSPEVLAAMLKVIKGAPAHLALSGLMGYEPHLTGLEANLAHPAVQNVLSIYSGFLTTLRQAGYDPEKLTLNGAGSHTLGIYNKDRTMNDLSAGSGVVKPTDFDTHHLTSNSPALFIATPILKRYDELKIAGDHWAAGPLQAWDPNMRRLYYIYGGFWKAKMVSPPGVADPLYESTNQSPIATSTSVDLQVDDYLFMRPTQSEFVMLQFGDLLAFSGDQIVDKWPVFHQTG